MSLFGSPQKKDPSTRHTNGRSVILLAMHGIPPNDFPERDAIEPREQVFPDLRHRLLPRFDPTLFRELALLHDRPPTEHDCGKARQDQRDQKQDQLPVTTVRLHEITLRWRYSRRVPRSLCQKNVKNGGGVSKLGTEAN